MQIQKYKFMTRQEIVTYEVAKLAKEKGFPQDVFGTCEMKSACYLDDGRFYKDGCIYPIENAYTAPTQSLLQRWLREEKGIIVIPYYRSVLRMWSATYELTSPYSFEDLRKCFKTYELALEDALRYALENLA